MKNQFRIKYDLESYNSIKAWKRDLARRSYSASLSDSTWKNSLYWIEKLIKSSDLSPDELIEEAISDSEKAEDRLYSCFAWGQKQGLDHSSLIIGVHGVLRGFYAHNKIDTRNWHSPKPLPRKVEQTDANHPLFRPNKVTKKLELNLNLIRGFLKQLNSRDEMIALCLLSTGLDIGDLTKINLEFVRSQSEHDRIYVSDFRNKNGEWIKTFFSKEATSFLRKYIKQERLDASDSDPVFITSKSERKKQFKLEHKREFKNDSLDCLPKGKKVDTRVVATNFRVAQQYFGIRLERKKQAPLRPKRFRHIFRQACQLAGIGDDMTRVFMGQKSGSSKSYQPKSREELEVLYEGVEPFVTVYSDPIASDLEKQLGQERQESKIEFENLTKKIETLEFSNKLFLTILNNVQKQIPNLSVQVTDPNELLDLEKSQEIFDSISKK